MSQEIRDIKWNGRPPALEIGEAVRFTLDGEAMTGVITAVKGRTVSAKGTATERGQVTFEYEETSGLKLSHTVVGPK